MSRPRGNRCQREQAAAAREIFEAAGWTCRLDFSQRGSVQHFEAISPVGRVVRLPVHGTPRSVDASINIMRQRCRRLLRGEQL